jgi:transketolase
VAGAASEIVRFVHLAVREMPGSGKPAELLDAAKISAQHIAGALRELARPPRRERDTTKA